MGSQQQGKEWKMQRIRNSWELVKASFSVLSADKELLIYPILSSIGLVLVSIGFFVPAFLAELFDSIDLLGIIVGFLFYFSQYFVITFFNSALVGAALIRLRGDDPTLRDGFRIAMDRLGIIFGYTAIAATIGMILRWLSERSSGLGRIAVSLVGMAWNLATFLAVPVLVVEEVGPLEAVQRSASLLKKTWGEQIVGNLSIGLISGLTILGLFIITLVPGIALSIWLENGLIMIPVALILILGIMALSLLSSTLNGIYAAAVYRYAAEGETGSFFDRKYVEEAFRLKEDSRVSR
jgi:hypothetical protein